MKRGPLSRAAALVASVALVVTACSGSATPSPSAASAPPASVPPAASGSPAGSAAAPNLAGTTINILTFTGPQIAEPLQRRAPDFEKLTGAKVNVLTVPFSDLYTKILTDVSTGTNSYDAFVFDPQWMGDFASAGYLADLSAKVKSDPTLQWNDIAPFFRDVSASYQGKDYMVPLDGDFHMVYYRTDIFQQYNLQPPTTWADYVADAQKLQGKDLNGDGQPDYGSCIAMKRGAQSYWWIYSIAGGMLQTQGTSQGVFFDTTNMTPLVKNDAFTAALNTYKTLSTLGPPDLLNDDVGATRGLFTSGRCALSLDWGDIGTLAIDPTQSKVQDKVGAVILPGYSQVLDRSTGHLVACDATTCPDAVNGVNHAPYAAYGGWSGAINAKVDQKTQDAAFDFLAYMSAPAQSNVDVTLGKTGFNPYRISQFSSLDLWEKAGMSAAAAQNYLGAIKDSLNSPNMILDMRIPKTQQYQQVVLDQALADFLAGNLTAAQTEDQIYNGWEDITNQQGRDAQLAAYKASLGVQR